MRLEKLRKNRTKTQHTVRACFWFLQFPAKGGGRERVAVPGELGREGGLFGRGAEHQRTRVQRGHRGLGHQLAAGHADPQQKRPDHRYAREKPAAPCSRAIRRGHGERTVFLRGRT